MNIGENRRIDCQMFLFTLFPEVVRQWTATRADHMILQIDFTDRKWQTCARTNILRPLENKIGENLPNKKLICFQFKQKSSRLLFITPDVIITSSQVIIAPDDVFLDQSEHRKLFICVIILVYIIIVVVSCYFCIYCQDNGASQEKLIKQELQYFLGISSFIGIQCY